MARKDAHPGSTEQIAERRIKAFDLRKRGNNYREIAKELAVSPATIVKDIKAVMSELVKEQQKEAADYKAMELDRLETLQAAIWDYALTGDAVAIDKVLKVMERRAKLLGLDAPAKTEGKLEILDPYSEEIKRLRKERGLITDAE